MAQWDKYVLDHLESVVCKYLSTRQPDGMRGDTELALAQRERDLFQPAECREPSGMFSGKTEMAGITAGPTNGQQASKQEYTGFHCDSCMPNADPDATCWQSFYCRPRNNPGSTNDTVNWIYRFAVGTYSRKSQVLLKSAFIKCLFSGTMRERIQQRQS